MTIKIHSHRFCLLFCIAFLFLTLSCAEATADLFASADVLRDPALNVKVNHETKRQNLTETLVALQKQSGVKLSAAPDCKAAKSLITARLHDMSLGAVLRGLSAVYGVAWRKENDVFVMYENKNELELQLMRLGTPDFRAESAEHRKNIEGQSEVLIAEVLQHFNKEQLADGVPFSKLPKNLQDKIRKFRNEIDVMQTVEELYIAAPTTLEESILQIETAQSRRKDPASGEWHDVFSAKFVLRTMRGDVIESLPSPNK